MTRVLESVLLSTNAGVIFLQRVMTRVLPPFLFPQQALIRVLAPLIFHNE